MRPRKTDSHDTGDVVLIQPPVAWYTKLAAISQIGTLIVVIVGYVFTVRPVFQFQRLQEQTAKLEAEKHAAEQALNSLAKKLDSEKAFAEHTLKQLQEKQAEVSSEVTMLQARLAIEKTQSKRLAAEMKASKQLEMSARKDVSAAELKLKGTLGSLDLARWELILLDVSFAYIRISTNAIRSLPWDKMDEYFVAEEKTWPRPYDNLLGAINFVSGQNQVSRQFPETYFDELRRYLESRRDGLGCRRPDFSEMHNKYLADIAASRKVVEQEVSERMEKFEKEYKDKGERLLITEEFRDSWRRSIRIGKQFEVDRRYREMLRKPREECDDAAYAVIKEFAKLKGTRN